MTPSAHIAPRCARACRPKSSPRRSRCEDQLRRELLSLDQTLRILEYEWQRDPQHFDLAARASQVVVINDVSLQLFIADAHGIVRSSSRPAIIGTDVSKRDYFQP